MKDLLWLFGLYAGWFALNRWILPRAGVQT